MRHIQGQSESNSCITSFVWYVFTICDVHDRRNAFLELFLLKPCVKPSFLSLFVSIFFPFKYWHYRHKPSTYFFLRLISLQPLELFEFTILNPLFHSCDSVNIQVYFFDCSTGTRRCRRKDFVEYVYSGR
jgi:hypothetical protein